MSPQHAPHDPAPGLLAISKLRLRSVVRADAQHRVLALLDAHRRLSASRVGAYLLDAMILANVWAVVAVSLFGGFDFVIWSASSAAKPVLVLLVITPLRLALRDETWLRSVVGIAWRRVRQFQAVSASVRDAVPIAVAVTIGTCAVGFIAGMLFEPLRPNALPVNARWREFFAPFAVWDGGWYFTIASAGYDYNPGAQSSIAFLPLYPLLVRAAAWPFGSSTEAILAAGIAVSCGAFTAALVVFHQLAAQMTGSVGTGRRAVLYLAVFPFSFYFTRIYAESLFLLLTVSAVALAYRRRWLLAGVAGALAAATRATGIVIAIPLIAIACAGRPPLRIAVCRLAAIAAVALGPLAYSFYVYSLTGDPLAWLRAHEQWGYSLWHLPTRHLVTIATNVEQLGLDGYLLQGGDAPYELMYAVVALGALALVPRVAVVCGAGLAGYVLVSILIPLSGNVLVSTGRYVAVLFPLFIALATLPSRRLHELILVSSSLLLAVLLALFVGWHPLH